MILFPKRFRTAYNQPQNDNKIEFIQGGLFSDELILRHKSILYETNNMTGIKHLNGTLSIARTEPGTASTEFLYVLETSLSWILAAKEIPTDKDLQPLGKW